MLSLFAKAHVIASANLHDLADKVIDMNSPGALREYIRELDGALNTVGQGMAQNVVATKAAERTLKGLHDQEAEFNSLAQQLVQAGKDDAAKSALLRLDPIEQQIQTQEQLQDSLAKEHTTLQQTVSALTAKKQSMVAQLSQLEAMTTQAKGLEQSASVLKQVNSVTANLDPSSLDNLTERAQQRLDMAQAQFDQQNGAMNDSVTDDLASAKADARLAELKAKMVPVA